MDLNAARALKERIRRAAPQPIPFATGIALEADGSCRVAILLECERDGALLDETALRRVLREAPGVTIEVAGAVRAAGASRPPATRDSLLRIGSSVGHCSGGVGSLGFFARRRADSRLGLVSCNHVIAMADAGRDGDAVTSPSALDGEARAVARLDGSYPRLAAGAPVDCAFAILGDGVVHDAASLPHGMLDLTPLQITSGLAVTTSGRVTRGRAGIVTKIEVDDVRIRYGTKRAAFHGVVQIGSAGTEPFCRYGDSGALIYTADTRQAVGVLFATSYVGGLHDAGWTWAHPVAQVADALGVDPVTA